MAEIKDYEAAGETTLYDALRSQEFEDAVENLREFDGWLWVGDKEALCGWSDAGHDFVQVRTREGSTEVLQWYPMVGAYGETQWPYGKIEW